MHLRSKLILAALAATALLTAAVSTVAARNFSVNEKNIEEIWNEALGPPKTKLKFIAAGREPVACRVTLLGHSTERTIKKETGTNQGTINHGEIETCTNGSATIKNESFPWQVRYKRFTGLLPRIRSVTGAVIGATFKIRESSGLTCEIATSLTNPAVRIDGESEQLAEAGLETTGAPEDVTAERNTTIPLGGEGLLCSLAGGGSFEGIGLVRNLPRTAKITVTLI